MPPRRRREAPKLSVPKLNSSSLPVNGLLDWGTSKHWDWQEQPCRYCGYPTHLRDDKGIPSDKVCAEESLADIAGIVRTHSVQGQL
ncbi:hypothetical protein ACIQZO_34900 [Streptomyces sp. NPDC097617]|uniref:hypothetical protein n=1 Tax=Streptomyces sp. NPDC097617 TaxID=3366091 RepID=UPI0037F385A3